MSALKRWLVVGVVSLVLALSGCGFGGNAGEAENERTFPGQVAGDDQGAEQGEQEEQGGQAEAGEGNESSEEAEGAESDTD